MTRRLARFANLRNGGNLPRARWTPTEVLIVVLGLSALLTLATKAETIWTEANAARLEREADQ